MIRVLLVATIVMFLSIDPVLFASAKGDRPLTAQELLSVGGSGGLSQCDTAPCITGGPGTNQGSKSCTAVGQSCTSCMGTTGVEDLYTPIDTNCTGANNQTAGGPADCTGTQGTGQCATSTTNSWGFICNNMTTTNNACLPANITIKAPQQQAMPVPQPTQPGS